MKISWEWLNSFVDLKNTNPKDVSDQLTLAGCEIEEIKTVTILDKKDYILDITSTPNRSDLLGIVGIAKEVSAILKIDQKDIVRMENNILTNEKNLKIINQHQRTSLLSIPSNHCYISNFSYQATPDLIGRRLKLSGLEVKNNISDIGNYIMLKWGHPVEITDISTMSHVDESDISFVKEELLSNIEDNERNHKQGIVVTKYNNTTVGLTGINTKDEYKPNQTTRNICVQTLIVPISVVRRNSKFSGIRNESSIRYERGLNKKTLRLALLDTILLIKKNYPKVLVSSIYNNIVERSNLEASFIKLNINRVRNVLGKIKIDKNVKEISAKSIETILVSLGCSVVSCDTFFEVYVPESRRNDLYREIDLIEEVARIHGFNNFKAVLPEFRSLQTKSSRDKAIRELTKKMRSLGMTESIHYSLTSENSKKGIILENPLLAEYSSLRTNLITNLIDSFEKNIKKGNNNFDAFEIGRVFSKEDGRGSIIEKEVVAGIFGGRLIRTSWQSPLKKINWFEAKGIIELLLDNIIDTISWKDKVYNQHAELLHPKRSASIFLKNQYLGTFGELHPQVIKQKSLPDNIYCFELNLVMLIQNIQHTQQYRHEFASYSSFPSITRDIAIIISLKTPVESIVEIINNQNYSILKHVQLFDEYTGDKIGNNQRSVTFRLIYQSDFKTLTTEKVDQVHEELKNTIKRQLSTQFR
nr:SyfB [Erythrotrichia welwitschii]